MTTRWAPEYIDIASEFVRTNLKWTMSVKNNIVNVLTPFSVLHKWLNCIYSNIYTEVLTERLTLRHLSRWIKKHGIEFTFFHVFLLADISCIMFSFVVFSPSCPNKRPLSKGIFLTPTKVVKVDCGGFTDGHNTYYNIKAKTIIMTRWAMHTLYVFSENKTCRACSVNTIFIDTTR